MEIPSYGKVLTLGHRDLAGLFADVPLLVQEKYDGSQISWAWDDDGALTVRSKSITQFGAERTEPEELFRPAVEHLLSVAPIPGVVFRGETISKPKHNTISYSRAPEGFIVLFDVEFPGSQKGYWGVPSDFAPKLGVEWAAEMEAPHDSGEGVGWNPEDLTLDALTELLKRESSLGGSAVEGVVIKNYLARDPHTARPFLAGKFVSEGFKETHRKEWRGQRRDIIEALAATLNTEQRWEKTIQHLSESGQLMGEPKDIGPLMAEVKADTLAEESDYIKEQLYSWALPTLSRKLGQGLPEWYKRRLAASQLGEE